MQALIDLLSGFVEVVFRLLGMVFLFLEDTFQMLLMLVRLPEILFTVLQWTSYVGILPYIVIIISLAILYKILGRE